MVQVFRIGENLGPHENFRRVCADREDPFIFTDPDIEFSNVIAEDFLSRLHDVSNRYRCKKVGAALEIPAANEIKEITMQHQALGEYDIIGWESQFWQHELEKNIYRANIDTTLFYWNSEIRLDYRRNYNYYRNNFRPRRCIKFIPRFKHTDIRIVGNGFVLRHLPWYCEDKMTEWERSFYKEEASRWSTWVR